MSLFAGAAVGGRAAVTQGFAGVALGAGASSATNLGEAPSVPRMDHSQAMRMIVGDAEALAEITEELYANERNISSIDPDILAMRSWSPMAKVTFQRRRNVERTLADIQGQRSIGRYIQAIDTRMNKLLWGR